MVTVTYGNVSLLGDVETITVDLLCLVDGINKLKEEEPETWNLITKGFKKLANDSDDNSVYEVMKQFITNLQDLY